MYARQQRALFSYRRATNFVDDRLTLTAGAAVEATALASQVQALKGVVGRMTTQATSQQTLAASATLIAHDEVELRKDLRDHHLRTIVLVAQGLKGTVPGIGVLTMPGGNPVMLEPGDKPRLSFSTLAPVLVTVSAPRTE